MHSDHHVDYDRDTDLPLDPSLRHVACIDPTQPVYTLSVEPVGRPVYVHPYHLGNVEGPARDVAIDVFEQVRADHGCYSVALMYPHPEYSHRVIYDIWDGLGWQSLHDTIVMEIPPLVHPVVNLNGNPAADLIDKLLAVKHSVVTAAYSMSQASDVIHGRNYQTCRHPDATRERAERAWVARLHILNAIAEDVEKLALEIQRQGRR